jgi:serine/threonine protein kinase
VTALFDAVRDLSDTEAMRRVDGHPSADVRKDVRRMLESDRRNSSPLRTIIDVEGAIEQATAAAALPAVVGGYPVTDLVLRGDDGVVFKGTCPKSGDAVAIKVIGIGAWSDRALERFGAEIKRLGELSHPAIARMLDAGTDSAGVSPRPFFVRELVEGETLEEWRLARQRTPREVVALFAEIAEALQHAHARGVTHRDLHPSAVLVTAEGRPKVVDFGVAALAALLAGTADGVAVGSLSYLSPEQVSGAQTVDARSDLYSLGVMMHEALSGRLPYDLSGRSLTEAALAIRTEPPTPLGAIDRSLRGDLEAIVMRLLAKEPAARYQSAQEILEDLRRTLDGKAAGVGLAVKRSRAWVVALLVGILLAGIAYGAYLLARG